MEEIQQERRERVREYCRSHGRYETITGKSVPDIMVDEQHNILYCRIYKVSSTQLRRMMANFSNRQFKWLQFYPDEERQRVLSTHFKFMFVRQPLERILSAFINKFYVVRDPMYRRMWGRPILKRYRPNATEQAIRDCDDITFPEFVHYVVDGGWDPHWAQYHRWCRVCAIDFDFIGRFENLQEELPYVFKAAGVQQMPHFVSPYTDSNTSSKVLHYYSQVPKKLLLRLVRLYRTDYEMFDYPHPGPLFEQLLNED